MLACVADGFLEQFSSRVEISGPYGRVHNIDHGSTDCGDVPDLLPELKQSSGESSILCCVPLVPR